MDKCSYCGKTSIIFLRYVGKYQCKKHFVEMFEKRFMRTIRENGEIKKGETISITKGNNYEVLEHLMKIMQKRIPFTIAKNAKTTALPFSANDIAVKTLLAFMKPTKTVRLPEIGEEYKTGKRLIKPLAKAPENEIRLYARLNGIRIRKNRKTSGLEREIEEHVDAMNIKYPGSIFKIIASLKYLKG